MISHNPYQNLTTSSYFKVCTVIFMKKSLMHDTQQYCLRDKGLTESSDNTNLYIIFTA